MNLDEYIENLRGDIAAFETFWKDSMAVDPENFPNDFDHPDWDEQFASFISSRD